MDLHKEFDKQYKTLVENDYPRLMGKTEKDFRKIAEDLLPQLENVTPEGIDEEGGYLDFVIVVKSSAVPPEIAMGKVLREGKPGVVKLRPLQAEDFETIRSEEIPQSPIYLLTAIRRGGEYNNVRPEDAILDIYKKSMHPLTIDEGIALVTHYPGFLQKNNCFSLLASRHTGDKRVPAIWINAKKQSNLGWCWQGNPHTWLGSAYAKQRLATP